MNRKTEIKYEAGGNSLLFALRTPLWITEITGLSGNAVTLSETQSVQQVGSTINSQSIQPRDLTINGIIRRDIEANRRGVLACVLPGVTGRLTVTEGGQSWTIEGAPSKTPEFSNGSTFQQFQFVLRCPYPYFRSTSAGSHQIAGLNNIFRFPCSLGGTWYISRYSESLFAAVENTGAVPTEFDVTFTAVTEVTDPELYHVERGSLIRLCRTMEAGESFTVSTVYGRKGVTLQMADGTTVNGFRYLDPASDLNLQLDPGVNTIRCDAAANREGLRVRITAPKGVVPGL